MNADLAFCLQSSRVRLRSDGSKKHLMVDLSPGADLAPGPPRTVTPPPGGLCWAAGGGSYVFGQRFLPLVRRSSDAPTNPGLYTIATGLAAAIAELFDPLLLIREGFEEIVIFENEETALLPQFSAQTPRAQDLNGLAANALRGVSKRLRPQLCHLPPSNALDLIELKSATTSVEQPALVHISDSQVANIMYPMHLPDIDAVELARFRLVDTETTAGGTPLRREVALYDLSCHALVDQNLQPKTPLTRNMLTAHAAYFIDRIGGYLGQNYR